MKQDKAIKLEYVLHLRVGSTSEKCGVSICFPIRSMFYFQTPSLLKESSDIVNMGIFLFKEQTKNTWRFWVEDLNILTTRQNIKDLQFVWVNRQLKSTDVFHLPN